MIQVDSEMVQSLVDRFIMVKQQLLQTLDIMPFVPIN